MASQPDGRASLCIVGTGYVGLASAIGFARLGHRVVGYDVVSERVAALRRGLAPYREHGLDDALSGEVRAGRLAFESDLDAAVLGADAIVICVQTPATADGSSDLRHVEAALAAVSRARDPASLVVLRSTVPVGTTDRLAARTGLDLVYAPEFLREGSALADFMRPDRIVVGTASCDTGGRYAALLRGLGRPAIVTAYKNAELIKCYSNAYLALKISFANEVASLCDAVGADALAVLDGVGRDHRIGPAFLAPGIGFGGPCFEKDLTSLNVVAARVAASRELIGATLRVNAEQPRRIVDVLESELAGLSGARVAVWGLAFKAGTGDVRDSIALRIVADLHGRGATVCAFDPLVDSVESTVPCVLAPSALAAADGADALLVLTEWPQFLDIPARAIASRLRRRVVVDGRNLFDPDVMADAGLRYRGVGRRAETAERLAAVS